ncbi:SAM-dependent methyltransferase [Spiribacter halobius]|uniref:SAM-dependent methyltransferase n=1 Tax=Sediminicurvatus halobius TaxID=2182432 RepID=A0A2U2N2Q7_9GAMM|nr:cyclopropane-fatty-acyl-phospholipid synthase family protein [Spiribacter halobius]PWG63337.1 SAM-dependent methyltransferase [Spiribacter halobius]UEX79184.1 cyclopropane-fatty-acyl-phospholipid synthase family protein [Spiribacter halobius]
MLQRILNEDVREGSLRLIYPDGVTRRFGSGSPEAVLEVADPKAVPRVVSDPEFMLGQTYMEGGWSTPDLRALLEVLLRNFAGPRNHRRNRFGRWLTPLLRPLQQWNRRAASRRNVAHHYDLDETLFRRFLDSDLQYSCAYWPRRELTLEQAQAAKRAHIRRKLCLRPGQRVLDIGCGWGGLAIELAEQAGAQVVGLTLSGEQARVARQRVRERGLEGQVEIRLEDYRDVPETFDRIVSVGMFEHVGTRYYDTYFRSVHEHLAPDGVALIHTIGRVTPPGVTNPWIRRYIFPGGYIPAMSEVMAAVERQRLASADVEVLRLHYAYTLAEWFRRFQRVRGAVAEEKGERFCRMWEFYLAVSEAAFHWRGLVVFQLQLAHEQTAMPLTRDYLYRPPVLGPTVEPSRTAASA